SGVVDENRNRAEFALDFLLRGRQRSTLRHVERDRDCLHALLHELVDHGAIFLIVAREDRDRRARLGKAERDSASNPAIAAGDDCDLSTQIEHLRTRHCASPASAVGQRTLTASILAIRAIAAISDEGKSRWDYGRLNSTKARCVTAARCSSAAKKWRMSP